MPNDVSDEFLFISLQGGDHAAFSILYSRYSKQLYIYVYKILRDEEEAWDVLQNVFTTIWKNAPKIEITVSLKAYLFRMARNFTINVIRKNKTHEKHIESFTKFLDHCHSQVDNDINFNELSKYVNKELIQMGPRMREIFIKCRLEGSSYREVALNMGITENTVRTVLHRATKELRKKLSLFNLNIYFLIFFL